VIYMSRRSDYNVFHLGETSLIFSPPDLIILLTI
jgi:hypothetical protein